MLTKSALVREIIDASADSFDEPLTRREVEAILDAIVHIAKEQLEQGEKFKLHGLATLIPKYTAAKAARPGRNPLTGEDMVYAAKPATLSVRATPERALKTGMPGLNTKAGKAIAAKLKK